MGGVNTSVAHPGLLDDEEIRIGFAAPAFGAPASHVVLADMEETLVSIA